MPRIIKARGKIIFPLKIIEIIKVKIPAYNMIFDIMPAISSKSSRDLKADPRKKELLISGTKILPKKFINFSIKLKSPLYTL